MRAVLFAMATAATLPGFRAMKSANKGSYRSGFLPICRIRDIIPMTSNRRIYCPPSAARQGIATRCPERVRDTTQPFLTTTGAVQGCQTKPSGKITTRVELFASANRCDNGGSGDRSNARYCLKKSDLFLSPRHLGHLVGVVGNFRVKEQNVFTDFGNNAACSVA